MKIYTADFETTTDPEDCRVWAWCICDTDNIERVEFGTDIESFINTYKEKLNAALEQYEPSILCKYALDLCKLFNKFFHSVSFS